MMMLMTMMTMMMAFMMIMLTIVDISEWSILAKYDDSILEKFNKKNFPNA